MAFDPTNAWFATGSADRTIKFWDTASGQLKLTLTGHIEQVRMDVWWDITAFVRSLEKTD